MGDMLRSDLMTFCDIYLQPEAAFEILSHLGEMCCVQFMDMNPDAQAFQRSYIQELCRCAEMERKLYFMEGEMKKDNIYIPEMIKEPKAMQPNEMLAMENVLEKWETDVIEMSDNLTNLMQNYLKLKEMDYVLTHIGPILGEAEIRRESIFAKQAVGAGDVGRGALVVMTGLVTRRKSLYFELMLWRISRGNIYYRQSAEDAILIDPSTRQEIRKVAFLAVCQGDQLTDRMKKVFAGFGVHTYPCPRTYEERVEMMTNLDMRISDLEHVIKKTNFHRCKALRTVGKQWYMWITQVKKAKAIYHTMNLFTLDITKRCLIGQCWVPDKDLKRVHGTLDYCSEVIETNVPCFMSKTTTKSVPPTFHRTNKFTAGFQALINAYGDAQYRELNPGLYTIITFPFLFAMMFGDIGHSFILIAFAGWMIKVEKKYMGKKTQSEIWNILFGGRYIILLLGLFSVYTGFIYNDMFGKNMVLQKSYWINQKSKEEIQNNRYLTLDPSKETLTPYWFGKDPVWGFASNSIMIQNSLKMKMSVIIGIVHMVFGVILSLINHIYFKNYHAIIFEFIPEILFLVCIFFWLVIMIYMKWFMFSAKAGTKRGSSCAPQILIFFIDMMLQKESAPVDTGCDEFLFEDQDLVELILLTIALVFVPILLLGSPIYVNKQNKKKRTEILNRLTEFRRYQHRESDRVKMELIRAEAEPYMTTFSELLINQAVHTIEFVLSTVSHTASYLRLWALSLAHYQLSEMLWIMIFARLALKDHTYVGSIKIFVIFAVWASFTVSILVVMEGLSAFLHTLRLHWVEFMSKFFIGGGYPFKPFCFKKILEEGDKVDVACKKMR